MPPSTTDGQRDQPRSTSRRRIHVPGDPHALVRRRRSIFIFFSIFFGIEMLIMVGVGANSLLDDYLYHAPLTQQVTATVTSTNRVCDKTGCGYDSYGDYTLGAARVTGVRLRHMTELPVSGEITVLVNPHRPRLAMDPYDNSYLREAIVWFGTALVSFALILLAFVMWRRSVSRVRRVESSGS